MYIPSSSRLRLERMARGRLLALLALVAVGKESAAIEFGDLKCKLPGWPGHPAPTCEPTVADQCCPGTKCLPDPFDASHTTCQQTESLAVADHALTANVLASHVEALTNDALAQLRVASTSLYLSNMQQQLNDRDVVSRAQSLVSNHGNVDTTGKQAGDSDWHKYAHGGAGKSLNNKADPPPKDYQGSNQGSAFDYSKYYNGGGSGTDSASSGSSQGGFDYSKYMPKNIPSNGGKDDKKDEKTGDKKDEKKGDKKDEKKDKGKDSKSGDASKEGQGGYDYSQYYPSGGDPHKKGYESKNHATPTTAGDGGAQDKNGFDYSQYWPKNSKNLEQPSGAQDSDVLKKAALELLDIDVQLHVAGQEARKDLLEKIKSILAKLQDEVDRELGPEQKDWSMTATLSPTLVWNDPNDFWSKYIPKMPNQGYGGQSNGGGNVQYNAGDRRPGSLGGPCGKTSYKEFGPCMGELRCEGGDQQKPGLCQMSRSAAVEVSRLAALKSLKLADEMSTSIKMAAMELLVGASPRMDVAGNNDLSKEKTVVSEDLTLTWNQTALDIENYSPMTVLLVVLGFAVIGYFCWFNGGRRKQYQSLDGGWGASGDRA